MSEPAALYADARLGPLAARAEAFVSDAAGDPLVRGPAALTWLTKQIQRFGAREVSAVDEARFVESAGAYLAAVLLGHFGEGAHASRDGVHRLRVGPRGFVDPFAMIERALVADSTRGSLVESITKAEAEAHGKAGIGRAGRLFEEALAASGSELAVTDRFDRKVFLEDIEVDLGRVVDVGEDDEGAARVAATKLASLLPRRRGEAVDVTDLTRDEALTRLVPRIVGEEFDAPAALFTTRLTAETRLLLQLGYEGRSRFVRSAELAAWSLSEDDAVRTAITNLAQRSERARFATVETPHGPLLYARTGDGLDAARLLLPGLPDVLATELGLPCLVAIPHRDVLFACALGDPDLEKAMAARVEDDAARAPHRISRRLFLVDRDGVRLRG